MSLALARLGGRGILAETPGRRTDRFSIALMAFVMLYSVFGVPGESATDTSKTDHVSPVNSYVWLAIFLLAMPVLIKRRGQVKALLLGCWPLLVLFAYFGLSTLWALDPSASTRRFLFTIVQMLIIATLLAGIRRAPNVHVVIAFACATAAYANMIAYLVTPALTITSDGFAGLQGQKNQAGLLMMLGYLSAVPCLWLVRSWRWRLFLSGGIMLMLVELVATRSSTSESVVVAATLSMPIFVWLSRRQFASVVAMLSLLPLGVGIAALCYLAYTGATGLDPFLPLRHATFSARTDIWSFVIGEIKKRPLFGAGYESFWSINPAIQPSLKTDRWFAVDAVINEAHDGYLDMLATNGLIGLVGALLVLFRVIGHAAIAVSRADGPAEAWQRGRLSRPTGIFYLSLMLGLVIHNFTESNLFSNNALLSVATLIAIFDLQKWRNLPRVHERT
jgi:O-antigen ligase